MVYFERKGGLVCVSLACLFRGCLPLVGEGVASNTSNPLTHQVFTPDPREMQEGFTFDEFSPPTQAVKQGFEGKKGIRRKGKFWGKNSEKKT